MGETRVNLRHLLEDIRDSYPFPQEEAIVTELIANALDSGASQISFLLEPRRVVFTIIDNGTGMNQQQLEQYHDIAATSKVRGKGIGFAGVGAKLALLVGEAVMTETAARDSHRATVWKLESQTRAPWESITPPGLLTTPQGTAVAIKVRDRNSPLISYDFVSRVIQTHFYPILDSEFMESILRHVYGNDIAFTINGQRVDMPPDEREGELKAILVNLGRRARPVGVGFLRKTHTVLPEDKRGIAISTFGKIIKRGWDWIGVVPRNPMRVAGVVEVPNLSEILTLNKADFLKDATSLQKYYRYRKAIQEALEPILQELGEITAPRESVERDMRPLEKEIERVLGDLLNDFPELSPLLDRRKKGEAVTGILPDQSASPIGSLAETMDTMTGTHGDGGDGGGVEAAAGFFDGERIDPSESPTESGRQHRGRRKRPGIMIGFKDDANRGELAWIVENTVWINSSHPAYQRVIDTDAEKYHIVLSVSWVLSQHLEGERSPQTFISRFLSKWGSKA